MKHTLHTVPRRLPAFLSACLLMALCSPPAWADVRDEAVSALSNLNRSDVARSMPDDVRSAETTFATAEHYAQSNDTELSERFYLLTLQKVRVLMASIPENMPGATSETQQPAVDTLQASPEQQPAEDLTPKPALPAAEPEVSVQAAPPEETEYFSDEIISEKLVGRSSTYSVVAGDTIRLVAAKLGVSRQHIISLNRLDPKAYLKIGQTIKYNNRKIVPQRMKNGIVVNIPDRTLYYFKKGKLAVSVPVALGVAVKNEKYDWKTPTGKFKVTAKAKDPTWYVPPSIQSEMEDQGKEVITSIPPGPQNPLGKYAIKTSIPGILIHSTTKPWSIYSYASHGCIRVYPEQMEELFKEVSVNTPGEIIYRPVKLAVTEEGRVFLEVHQDVYGKSTGLAKEARLQIEKLNLAERVNWKKVESVLRQKAGIAEDISL